MGIEFDQIIPLMESRGAEQYGSEAVSQLEHALQCATLAEQAGSEPGLIVASLLHDFGHLIHELGDDPAERGIDDVHQYMALPFLRPLFPEAVLEPIRLHVDAKRFLCAVEKGYRDSLSPASKLSLELQGGVYSSAEAERFVRQAHAMDAVKLRRWDELAKTPGKHTPDLSHFMQYLQACRLSHAAEPVPVA